MAVTFEEFFRAAVSDPGAADRAELRPYAHQIHLAEHGLPEVLVAPTGTGKTEAAVLGHLYRRYAHPDDEVRSRTPRWLVMALPTRGLVEQTVDRVRGWVRNLGPQILAGPTGGLTVDDVHCVMGGEGWEDRVWQRAVSRDAIFVGTVDMLLSRALNRGYASSRWVWPISFGVFNNGVQWVFDEVQQMELAAITSRQLQAFREQFGTFLPVQTMWMSATLDDELLHTVDAGQVDESAKVDAESFGDLGQEFQRRAGAAKVVREFKISDRAKAVGEIATRARELHRPGLLTLVVCNQVKRAQGVFEKLAGDGSDAELVLLHRRFRPAEREKAIERALDRIDPRGPGRIVVATQVLEAGIDIDAAVMITELAPWPSIVQRAGRCNRRGLIDNAIFEWIDITGDLTDANLRKRKESAPYDPDDLVDAAEALRDLENKKVTPSSLPARGPKPRPRVHHVLRRRDLIELFDTSPDLTGDVVDVSQFIRDGDERDVFVAWRCELSADMRTPSRSELCPVSVDQLRSWMIRSSQKAERVVYRIDPLANQGTWAPASADDLRPGQMYVLASAAGGYTPELGWRPESDAAVAEVEGPQSDALSEDEREADEPASQTGEWYSLEEHLADVKKEAERLLDAVLPDLPDEFRKACVTAAALHDLGKAHQVWQSAARNQADNGHPAPSYLLAKTPKNGRLVFEQPYFRHELASLVALCGYASVLLGDCLEPDLCRYLVGAHHGRVRLSIRSIPGEKTDDGRPVMLGVVDGSQLPAIETPLGHLADGELDLVGASADWTRAALKLRDRKDLGPFRLAFLEAVVRLADWQASARLVDRGAAAEAAEAFSDLGEAGR